MAMARVANGPPEGVAAAVVPPVVRRTLNPLAVSGTELPPNLLLMAKVITLCFILLGQVGGLSDHFLPFLLVFDRLGSPLLFHRVLQVVFVGAALLLFFNRHVRTCCLVLGATILVSVLSSRGYYENNRLFTGCVLFLTGLSERGRTPWALRAQIVLVYFGASLNKLLDLDWRSGQFFENWAVHIHRHRLYSALSSFLPPMLLSKLCGWTTIFTESCLWIGFLVPQLYRYAIWGGILFHSALLISTGYTFGMFFYAMLLSYLAFVQWPSAPMAVLYDADCGLCERTRRLFEKFDFERAFGWVALQNAGAREGIPEEKLRARLHVAVGDKVYSGFAGFKIMLLYNPVTYFVFGVLLTLPEPAGFLYRRWIAAAILVVFSPVFAPVGESAYEFIARHRYQLSRVCAIPPNEKIA